MLRRLIAGLLSARPDPQVLRAAAIAAMEAGDAHWAKRHAERALSLDPGLNDLHGLLAAIAMPGEGYFDVLARLHDLLRPRTYIEVGVERGTSIRLARPETLALGIDPAPVIEGSLGENVRIFAETSDAFFGGRDVRAELGGLPVDLAFIDGMHHFEYALRDFVALERLCTPRSTILLHDCYPCHPAAARRERVSTFWTGDIWRVVVLLKKHRPGLRIHTIATHPSGLCVIRGLDPASTVLAGRLESLYAEGLSMDYPIVGRDPAAALNLVANEWDRVAELFADR
jgi:hypothetical protein